MIPEPTPVDGIWNMPRVETPSEVIVTTEFLTLATTVGRSGALAAGAEPVDVVTPVLAAAGGDVGDVPRSGPATNAVVIPDASTADSTATPTIVPPRRRPEPLPLPPAVGEVVGACTGAVHAYADGVPAPEEEDAA